MKDIDYKYYKKLSEDYPDIESVSAKIIELSAMLKLPKGTEHFLSDVHGEHEAFFHVIKSGSGAVRRKIDDALGDSVSKEEKDELACIIYYPKEKMELIQRNGGLSDHEYGVIITRLLVVCRKALEKYPGNTISDYVKKEYEYLISELLRGIADYADKEEYYKELISSSVAIGNANDLIKVLADFIRKLVIARLHIIGDIFDRGPGPHFIMDFLEEYENFDIQWGNHDVVWMGAALGHGACICNILRNSLRYDSLDIISDGYGINMIPLMQFAAKYYKDDPCEYYYIKGREITYDMETQLTMKMHKAISIIQWKLEAEICKNNPDFKMDDRMILDKINYEKGTVCIDGRDIVLDDMLYPTVDPNAPFELNKDEKKLVDFLEVAFYSCEKLRRHVQLLVKKGGMYSTYNGNLMFHGFMPLNPDGSFRECSIFNKTYKGKEWNDALEEIVRKGFESDDAFNRAVSGDVLWYLWCGPDSPIFGKKKMATFERYLLDDKESQKEEKDSYFKLLKDEDKAFEMARNILTEFGLDPDRGIIVNGHVPVKQKKGENPVKAKGKIYVIDGGFSKSYHKETGIAGYTLISNSRGKVLVAHMPFTSTEDAIKNGSGIVSEKIFIEEEKKRLKVADTDLGREIEEQIEDLKELLNLYKKSIF